MCLLVIASVAFAEPTALQKETVTIPISSAVVFFSERQALQSVQVKGNISLARLDKDGAFPTTEFMVSSKAAAIFTVTLLFDYPSDYTINLGRLEVSTNQRKTLTSYYVSKGPFSYIVDVTFEAAGDQTAKEQAQVSPWSAFSSWLARFSQAFPMWVKILYLVLGFQFGIVGFLWLRFEDQRRGSEGSSLPFDLGNKVYMWSETVYKFLMCTFLIIVLIMGGEFVLLFVLRFMFLAPIELFTLWDLYVLGFAATIAFIAYLVKTVLEKSLDLKPLEDS